MEDVEYSTVSELFSEDNRQRDSTCIELERDLVLPNKFVRFYESPRTGRPVDKMKKFIKDEPMDFPVDDSNLNTSAIIEPVESPTQIEQDSKDSQTHQCIRDRSPSP